MIIYSTNRYIKNHPAFPEIIQSKLQKLLDDSFEFDVELDESLDFLEIFNIINKVTWLMDDDFMNGSIRLNIECIYFNAPASDPTSQHVLKLHVKHIQPNYFELSSKNKSYSFDFNKNYECIKNTMNLLINNELGKEIYNDTSE